MRSAKRYRTQLLLDDLGISEPEDIDIEAIAYHYNARVVYERLEGCAAWIIGHGDHAVIRVDERSTRGRQRFSAAHELGHWMLDRKRLTFSCAERDFSNNWSTINPERRANVFATELLLPEALFKRDSRDVSVTLDGAKSLAEIYNVSIMATAIRLVECGPMPALIVCTDMDTGLIKWFLQSPDIPAKLLQLRDQPGRNTLAIDILAGKGTNDSMSVAADSWFVGESAGRYSVTESSWITGDVVLTLLWWEDESYLMHLIA